MPETRSQRRAYVEGLQVEREHLASRTDSPTKKRRLGEVDKEIARYGSEPNGDLEQA